MKKESDSFGMDELIEIITYDEMGKVDYVATKRNFQCVMQGYIDDAKNAVKDEMETEYNERIQFAANQMRF